MKLEGLVVHAVNQPPRQFLLIDFKDGNQLVTGVAFFKDIKKIVHAHACILQVGDTVRFSIERRGNKYYCKDVESDITISNPNDRELSRVINVVQTHKRRIWFAERHPCRCHVAFSSSPGLDMAIEIGSWITHRTEMDKDNQHYIAVDIELAEAPVEETEVTEEKF